MIWSKARGAYYATGTTTYRITVYPTFFFLMCWYPPYNGWAMLAKAAFVEEAMLFAECEEVFQQLGVP